jgi:hypothetical protein
VRLDFRVGERGREGAEREGKEVGVVNQREGSVKRSRSGEGLEKSKKGVGLLVQDLRGRR